MNDEGARRYRDVAAVAFPEEMLKSGEQMIQEKAALPYKKAGRETIFPCLFCAEAKMEQSKSGFV